jgi:hypothetical protein
MLTRITVHVESMEGNIPKYTERHISLDLDTDVDEYMDTIVALASRNLVPLVVRTLEQHLDKTGRGPTKQLSENEGQGSSNGKEGEVKTMPEVPAVAPTEVIPPGGSSVREMQAQHVDMATGPA